jgi:HEAT repeat protein
MVGAPAVESLGAVLNAAAEEMSARTSAAEALGMVGAPAVDCLIAALGEPDQTVRDSIVRYLGSIGDPRAVEPLGVALKHAGFGDAIDIVGALIKIGNAHAHAPRSPALKAADMYVRDAIVSNPLILTGSTDLQHALEPRLREWASMQLQLTPQLAALARAASLTASDLTWSS